MTRQDQSIQRWKWDPALRRHSCASQQFYHVGCGRPLFSRGDLSRGMMAIACYCGANGPIVVRDLDDPNPPGDVLPASLILAVQRHRTPPHLEYFLGFSDFTCPAKEAWERCLRQHGAISYTECSKPGCRENFERGKARHERRRP